jgi:hypothetical protein
MQFMSTVQGAKPVLPRQLESHEAVVQASEQLPDAVPKATDWLAPLGEEWAFEESFGLFAERLSPVALIEAVLSRHERVQDEKGGKRSWLERSGGGFYVRAAYRRTDDLVDPHQYLHPYRVEALTSFVHDLGMGT